MLKIKTGSYLELEITAPETMKLLRSTKTKITKNENGDYQQDSRVLYTFVPNKSFGQLLDISPKN